MKTRNKGVILVCALVFGLAGCTSFFGQNAYQDQSREVINYLLSDMPLPEEAEIKKVPTVILGTGNGIAGRIVLESEKNPAANLIFYSESTVDTGWSLISSTVAEEIVLTYTKDGRYATIEILKTSDLYAISSSANSVITISVVHPNAVQQQNPYAPLSAQARAAAQ